MILSKNQYWRDVHGILLLDKPRGLSSNKALQTARKAFAAKKAGHTGSLDPLATGLLPICFGEATKIAGLLLGSRKAYECECELGVNTDTDDAEGAVIRRRQVAPLDTALIEREIGRLSGTITQTPPAFSALKIKGTPAYRLARRGESVQLAPRSVEIFQFRLLERSENRLRLFVECGSGTYIRSLARDLGEYLGCGAHLTALRRTWVEPFTKPSMVTLEELNHIAQQGDVINLDQLLVPVVDGLKALPTVILDKAQEKALRHGLKVPCAVGDRFELCKILGSDGNLSALADLTANGELKARRVFNL